MPGSLTTLLALLVYLVDFAAYLLVIVPLRSAFLALKTRLGASKTAEANRKTVKQTKNSLPSSKASVREQVRRALSRRALSKAKPSVLQRFRATVTSLLTSSLRVCRRNPLAPAAYVWRLASCCCLLPRFLAQRLASLLRRGWRSMRSASSEPLRHCDSIDPAEGGHQLQVPAASASAEPGAVAGGRSMSHNMVKCSSIPTPNFQYISRNFFNLPYLYFSTVQPPQAPVTAGTSNCPSETVGLVLSPPPIPQVLVYIVCIGF